MTDQTDPTELSGNQSRTNDPPHPRSSPLSEEDLEPKIRKPSRFHGPAESDTLDVNQDPDDVREFVHALEEETDIPKLDAASRDEVSLERLSYATRHIPSPIKLISGGILGLLLIVVLFLGINKASPQKIPATAFAATTITSTATETISQEPLFSGPQAGTIMALGDGSVLVFVPDPNGQDSNGQKGFWMTLRPITKYQYSLCVQSGHCLDIPDGDTAQVRPVETPVDTIASHTNGAADSAIIGPEIVGPDLIAKYPEIPSGYCGWLKGRAPTDSELTAFQSVLRTGETGIQDDTVRGLGDGSVHNLTGGIHCIVDHPLPMAQFVSTSPYYDPTIPMEDVTPKVLKTEQFCQSNQGFQTVDLQLDKDASILSVTGDGKTHCQTVDGNRIVCYGAPDTSPQAIVGLLSDGSRGARCQIGSEFDGDGCSNNLHGGPIQGMDDWELDSNGILLPVNGVQPPGVHPAASQDQNSIAFIKQLPNGGLLGPALQKTVIINGVMVAMSLPGNAIGSNELPGNSISGNGISSNGIPENGSPSNGIPSNGSAGNAELLPAVCPQGYYFDQGLQGCASLGAPQAQCLDGYHFNREKLGCEADQPDGSYPGCPAGQVLNPLNGQCDASSKMLSPTSVVTYEPLQVNLPDCSAPIAQGGDDSGGNTGDSTGGSTNNGGPSPYCITHVCP